MRHAGFVLTGGRSTRMGRDKALLPYGSRKLAEHVAAQVLEAGGSVTLIGDPASYGHLGYPVFPDRVPAGCDPNRGPLGGIYTALSLKQAEWNLILACDLPNVRPAGLRQILDAAASAGASAECVVPCVAPWAAPGGAQPLCAAYHARCLPKLEAALRANRLKMMDLLDDLEAVFLTGFDAELFQNVNTPADWEQIGMGWKS